MLDIRYLRENYEDIRKKLVHRGEDLTEFDKFGTVDERRRQLIGETEKLKAQRNDASKQISALKREQKDATDAIQEMRKVSDQIKTLDAELAKIEQEMDHIMLSIPNIPHESVPIGESEDDNLVHRTWGETPDFTFEPKAHWDIAAHLNILNFERA